MKVEYTASVHTEGKIWRPVRVTAMAVQISPGKIKILSVSDLDGNGSTGYASRTGARRQSYSVSYFAQKEVNKIKFLSSVHVVLENFKVADLAGETV